MFRSQPHTSSQKTTSKSWRKRDNELVWFRDDKQHRFRITPFVSFVFISTLTLSFATLAVAAGFLFLKDDVLSSTMARHEKQTQDYENRIADLRSQVDLMTSRRILDQRVIEKRMVNLLARQEKLGLRALHVTDILSGSSPAKSSVQRLNSLRLKQMEFQPNPTKKSSVNSFGLRLGSLDGSTHPFGTNALAQKAQPDALKILEQALMVSEQGQISKLAKLKADADRKSKSLKRILSKQGIRVPDASAVGGPLIALKGTDRFRASVNALKTSLQTLKQVRKAAHSLPQGSPTPGRSISSRFGTRRDPFTGSHAMHGGLDFKARRGTPVRATGAGRITKAKRMGGYGKLIEINHGGGITTRYAHLNKIRVKVGQRVTKGFRIGDVGSTGRSTGPHLHYEVRRKGRVLNPIHYVRLAKRLKPYL